MWSKQQNAKENSDVGELVVEHQLLLTNLWLRSDLSLPDKQERWVGEWGGMENLGAKELKMFVKV